MKTKKIILAGGCFWGVEKFFALLKGVHSTETAYVNGDTENPSYEQVCRENTNHAEAILVEYNPLEISLEELLDFYYQIIDPTSLNKQGNDVGTQYRTGIYFVEKEDLDIINSSLQNLQKSYSVPIAIEVLPLQNYYKAEEYHQKYLDKNPNGYCHINQTHFAKAERSHL